jgi:RimJ/RimL family protein N-acetyltransferase
MPEFDQTPRFRLLAGQDASLLAELLSGQRRDYMRQFVPFAFEATAIRSLLDDAGPDRYWGIEADDRLVGLVMLRGFRGYSRPSFGLAIAEEYSGRGIGRAALDFALAWCRSEGIGEVMLKVADDNVTARRLYEKRGFILEGTCKDTGHLVHSLKLSAD